MNYRFATREDVPLILNFIKELASYEKMLDEVFADEKHWKSGFLTNRKQK